MSDETHELDHLKRQCDALGSQLLRRHQQLTQSRRDVRRLLGLTALLREIHGLTATDLSAEEVPRHFLRILIERMQWDALAILEKQPSQDERILASLGQNVEELVALARAGDQDGSRDEPAGESFARVTSVRHATWWLISGRWERCPLRGGEEDEQGDRETLSMALDLFAGLLGLKQSTATLGASEARYRAIVDSINEAILIVDPDTGYILDANRAATQIFRRTQEQLCRLQAAELQPGEHAERVALFNELMHRAQDGVTQRTEWHWTGLDGRDRWLEVQVGQLRLEGRQRVLFVAEDISDRRQAEARAIRDAFYDSLTGLPNRTLLLDRLEQSLVRARRQSTYSFAVLVMDLDRFKHVNDSLGYRVGNQLLASVALRLQHSVRPGDTLARLGGDEFAILLDSLAAPDDVHLVAGRIMDAIRQPVHFADVELLPSASMGVAVATRQYERADDILRDAELAMYDAKANGSGRYVSFQPKMHRHAVDRLRLENELRRALSEDELRLVYQPLIDLGTGRLSGFEALVRWQHPVRGLLTPDHFIPLAEESGLIIPLGAWVLEEACRRAVVWQRAYPDSGALSMSVNLSRCQLMQTDLAGQIQAVLERTQYAADRLCLEITESAIMDIGLHARTLLETLRALGIQLSMDDFGTGYSSLSFLHHFPLDTLKIDRSFVQRMEADPGGCQIVSTIVNLGHGLGLKVVAEGIETRAAAELLRTMACDWGQGYLFARPLTPEDAERLLREPLVLPPHP